MGTQPIARRYRIAALSLALLIVAALMPALPPPARAAELPRTVEWGGQERVWKTGVKTIFPSAVIDSNNHLHVIYSIEADGDLWYTNDVSGKFAPPTLLDGLAGKDGLPFYALALGPGDRLHVAYAQSYGDRQIYYRSGALSGGSVTWTQPQKISDGGAKSYQANLAVDRQNNAHIVWIDERGVNKNVFYRVRYASGALSARSTAPLFDGTFQQRPQIVVTGDGKPHVVFQRDSEIYYARLEPTGWVLQNVSNRSKTNSQNPALATDGTALYLAWDENVRNHDILFRRSTDGGLNWSQEISYSQTSAWASFPALAWSPVSRRVYLSWSDESLTNDKEIWFSEFDPQTKLSTEPTRISFQPGRSMISSIAVGPGRAEIVWDGEPDGVWQIWHARGAIKAGCKGTLTLAGGSAAVNSAVVPATIAPQSCAQPPDQMQVSVDTPVGDTTPKQPYQASFNVTIPAGDTCAHTVYARLLANGTPGPVFSDTITVDTGVTARVAVRNPFMPGNAPPFTPVDGGAPAGDPRYTRNGQAFLRIDGSGDCTGLKEFSVPGNSPSAIAGGAYSGYVDILQGTTSQGEKPFQVGIKDALGTSAMFPSSTRSFSLTYDAEPPVLDMTASPTVTAPLSTTSLLVTLAFSDTHVRDNLYGERESLADDAEFWGVYAANSRDPAPDLGALKWVAVPVDQPGATFSIHQWSLFGGLGYGPAPDKAGDYYVFVRFVDGAGNVSNEVIRSRKIMLAAGYTVPARRLPLVRR